LRPEWLRLLAIALGIALPTLLPCTAHGTTLVDAIRSVRMQGCRDHAGTREPLRAVGGLGEAALGVSRGRSLTAAIAASGYREQESTLLHVSGDADALQRALSGPLCGTVTDGHFRDVGVAQRGHETWIVFAVPFAPPAADSEAVDAELLQRINLARSHSRRCGNRWFDPAPPLADEPRLRAAAQAHARDMLDHDYFAHEGHDGSNPAQRVGSTGYRYRLIGENIASGATTAQEAVDGWIASPGHCENLMDPRFTQSGVAYAASRYGAPRILWVQDFGAPR
jgi:uncharacterized protein YkwD